MRCYGGPKLAIAGLLLGALVLSAGCTKQEDKYQPFDGFYFRAKVSAVDKKVTLADFTATVWPVSQSLDGARQAAEFEGVKYCIGSYGSSTIKWSTGPDTAPESLAVIDDKLTFAGTCAP